MACSTIPAYQPPAPPPLPAKPVISNLYAGREPNNPYAPFVQWGQDIDGAVNITIDGTAWLNNYPGRAGYNSLTSAQLGIIAGISYIVCVEAV